LSATGVPITQWNTGLGNPCGIAIDASGNIYVVNTDINNVVPAVLKYSANGTPITQWGFFGTGNGQFEGPDGIAVGPNGIVYVSDNDYNPSVCRVEEFSSNGTYLGQWGGYGNGNGQFDVANSIAVNASGDVYVLDFGNHRVQEFSATGAYITQWGSYGSGNGQFESPLGVGVDPSGIVYVADGMLYRIQEFTSSGAFITQWSTPVGAPGYLDEPDGVAVNANGIYISNVLMPPSIPMPG
jgi:DNA-binding beta-propeller fold protein YncE